MPFIGQEVVQAEHIRRGGVKYNGVADGDRSLVRIAIHAQGVAKEEFPK